MDRDLAADRFYYLGAVADPVLQICRDEDGLDEVPLERTGGGRRQGEALWSASLAGVEGAGGSWQFRIVGAVAGCEQPPFAAFYTTGLRSLWLQDGQIFAYRPAPAVSPSQVIKIDAFEGSLPPRSLYIYLPRGYREHGDLRYPVLYMHDGQNCFERFVNDSFAGSWRAEETADWLIGQGLMRECIIAGVGNGGEARILEYLPPYASFRPPPRRPFEEALHGNDPADFLRRPLLPIRGRADQALAYYRDEISRHINSRYRTQPGREHTATCGSSMGGLFSAYIAWEHPEFARHHAILSPSLWMTRDEAGDLQAIGRVRNGGRPDVRLWLDSGTLDAPGRGDDGQQETQAMRDALLAAGYQAGPDFQYYLDEGATHSEAAWAARLPMVFQFLFPVLSC